MKKLLISLALISLSSITNAGVYQCKVNGSLTYQDKPCAGSKQQAQQIKEKQDTYKNDQAAQNIRSQYLAKPEPYIGMTVAEAEKSRWGLPSKVNRTTNATGVSEQWVFRRNGGDKYLYFRGGKLTSISE